MEVNLPLYDVVWEQSKIHISPNPIQKKAVHATASRVLVSYCMFYKLW